MNKASLLIRIFITIFNRPKIIKITKYLRDIRPPFYQLNGHLQTIVPALFRKVSGVNYIRERIHTPDGDFLDLDWSQSNSNTLVIICHGLEGDSSRAYVKGMVKHFYNHGWDVLAWNYRGCSGETNRSLGFYHSGATDDLRTVINHVLMKHNYERVSLLGFSLGGNLILKYLGESASEIAHSIHKAIGISVPLNLLDSCLQISNGFNKVYSLRFLKMLKAKVKRKARHYPESIDLNLLKKTNSLLEFDDCFTAPIHGFEDAVDYYQRCSAIDFIESITIPTLIVNAMNDPFLAPSCYPVDKLEYHHFVELMVPRHGGHCGFADKDLSPAHWSEVLAWNYLNS